VKNVLQQARDICTNNFYFGWCLHKGYLMLLDYADIRFQIKRREISGRHTSRSWYPSTDHRWWGSCQHFFPVTLTQTNLTKPDLSNSNLIYLFYSMAQQLISGPGPPHWGVSRSCGRTPWAWSASRKFLIIPDPPTRVLWQLETRSREAGDCARNMATQFWLQSVSTLIGFFYMP
jgi:hypothetical protein